MGHVTSHNNMSQFPCPLLFIAENRQDLFQNSKRTTARMPVRFHLPQDTSSWVLIHTSRVLLHCCHSAVVRERSYRTVLACAFNKVIDYNVALAREATIVHVLKCPQCVFVALYNKMSSISVTHFLPETLNSENFELTSPILINHFLLTWQKNLKKWMRLLKKYDNFLWWSCVSSYYSREKWATEKI